MNYSQGLFVLVLAVLLWRFKTYATAYVKIHKKKDILSIMSNLQPYFCLKVDFQKVDQNAGD